MPQASPLGPLLPLPADRPADARERASDDQVANRQAFGKMLDRFSRSSPANEAAKETTRDSAKASGNDPADDQAVNGPDRQAEHPDSTADTKDGNETADAKSDPVKSDASKHDDAGDQPVPSIGTAEPVRNPTPVVVTIPGLVFSAPPPAAATATAGTQAEPPVTVASAPAANVTHGAQVAEAPLPLAAAIPDASGATATAAALRMDRAAMPAADERLTAIAAAAGGDKPRAATPAVAQRRREDANMLQFGPPPRAGAKSAALQTGATGSAEQKFKAQEPSLAGDTAPSAGPAGLAAPSDGQPAPQRGADPLSVTLAAVDSPRSALAHYHRVEDVAARFSADAASPTDQLSIRLAHAAASGQRAIQVHLHPSELGSIDVKMQWQGDRLTAQFTVDRPETLDMLRRDQPALERSLSQAGVNVDAGSLSFSLRQQQGNTAGNGQGSATATRNIDSADAADGGATDMPLGQVIRDGILSIRV